MSKLILYTHSFRSGRGLTPTNRGLFTPTPFKCGRGLTPTNREFFTPNDFKSGRGLTPTNRGFFTLILAIDKI